MSMHNGNKYLPGDYASFMQVSWKWTENTQNLNLLEVMVFEE